VNLHEVLIVARRLQLVSDEIQLVTGIGDTRTLFGASSATKDKLPSSLSFALNWTMDMPLQPGAQHTSRSRIWTSPWLDRFAIGIVVLIRSQSQKELASERGRVDRDCDPEATSFM
jgi:hypothetical protein